MVTPLRRLAAGAARTAVVAADPLNVSIKDLTLRPRPIVRQLWRWQIGELAAPISQESFEFLALQMASLPHGIVGILQGQWRERILAALAESLIKNSEFFVERDRRPSIRDDVVEDHQEDMITPSQLEELCAQ